ncbi:putrescine aminopropyltransferase [Coemansia sp. RSA 2049]|nr:putrescine aminopropyltransferase [Coemansia sp. RSA 1939]KAJ2519752.1 putrescine aminopropyltransferase [Coemansia sp. RSA 2049]KAJ2608295.1 putrescine aminopropyltransferase [Coemansia sp. RSA 1804]KAJ2654994.1 putrescine aminopropyltransferase [Coemansia sp. RSA 1285]
MSSSALTHSTIKNGWYSEVNDMWPGQSMNIEVDEILHVEKSKLQDVLVFKSKTYGNVLVLDGIIQVTERDEFSYQEMITHPALFSHPNPERVLVIGGGDGGVLREVIKHPQVKEAVLCDIDETVIRVSKKYLPDMSISYTDPRVTVHIGDGFDFLKNKKDYFDVIITDSSDPVGPAEKLYESHYYELMSGALRTGGIVSAQGECQWLDLPLIKSVTKFARDIFPVVKYAYTTIPTYTSGQIGFVLCAKDASTNFKEPLRRVSSEEELKLFKYYNSEIHRASFALPNFTRKEIEDSTN